MSCVDGLKLIPDNSVQIIIADPPYNIGKNFGNNKTKLPIEEYIDWCREWLAECKRVLKPNGTMFIYGFSEILMHIGVDITSHFDMNLKWIVWHYTNKTIPSLKFWQTSHESILCCWKDERVFNRDLVREPYTDTFLKNSAGKKRTKTIGRFSNGEKETIYTAHADGALPRDVIKIPTLAGGSGKTERVDHPTQKPIQLCEKLLKSCMQDDGSLVLIPFAGSGSECCASATLNLNWIGFEINEEYVSICNERLAKSI